MALRDDFKKLAARPLPVQSLPHPEYSELPDLFVKAFSGADRDWWEAGNVNWDAEKPKVEPQNARGRMAVRAVVDAGGSRVFTDDDADWVGMLHSAFLERVYDTCRELSGMTKASAEALAKNSATVRGGVSPSTSPDTSAGPASNGDLVASVAAS